jgi:hypothetical protein
MAPNVTAQVHRLPKGTIFTGDKALSAVWVEWKVSSYCYALVGTIAFFFKLKRRTIHLANI